MSEAPKRIWAWMVGNGHGSWADADLEVGPLKEHGTPYVPADLADGYRKRSDRAVSTLEWVLVMIPKTDVYAGIVERVEKAIADCEALAKGDEGP